MDMVAQALSLYLGQEAYVAIAFQFIAFIAY